MDFRGPHGRLALPNESPFLNKANLLTYLSQLAFCFRRRREKQIFKMRQWRPPCIVYRNDFSYFALQDTLMFPTKFQASWPFGSVEEAN